MSACSVSTSFSHGLPPSGRHPGAEAVAGCENPNQSCDIDQHRIPPGEDVCSSGSLVSQKKRRRARNALSRRRPVSNWILQFQLLTTVQCVCHDDMTASQCRSSTEAASLLIVFREPGFCGIGIRKILEVIGIANRLAGVDVDPRRQIYL
jgi:predicted nucleic acid-binding Zn ribbon protein